MKLVLTLSFFLFGCSAFSQQIYTAEMDVFEINRKNEQSCDEKVFVVWGVNGDTVTFNYNGKMIELWILKKQFETKEDKVSKKKIRLMGKSTKTDFIHYMTDIYDERWLMRHVIGEKGMIIFLNNVTTGRPIVAFDYTETVLCDGLRF